ncbi:MAG: ribonuclease P protein component [Desulfatibacillaceae bacterium]
MGSFSFTKQHRLLKRSEFTRLARGANKKENSLFIGVYKPGLTGENRLGVTVTKKVGTAARRNRIKRCVREVYRKRRPDAPHAYDVNVIAKRHAAKATSSDLLAAANDLFDRIHGRLNH